MKEKFILIPNCSIIGWRLEGYIGGGFTDTEGKYYREVVQDMVKYFDKIGASKEEILTKQLVCADGSGGGALAEIGWAFKMARDVIKGKIDRKELLTEEFEEKFEKKLRMTYDMGWSARDAIFDKYCRLVPSWDEDTELQKLELEHKFSNESLENINAQYDFSKLDEILDTNMVFRALNALIKRGDSRAKKLIEEQFNKRFSFDDFFSERNRIPTELDLSDEELEVIPESIGEFKSMKDKEVLNLCFNYLKKLPESI